MPSVSYNGQSILLDGRRIWVLGGTLAYARIPREEWADRIRSVRDAGLNTVSVPCPWSMHETRKGKYLFEGQADVAEFVRLCHADGLRVILRPGPFVGDGFDGGGLPSWLSRLPDVKLREKNEAFIDRMARYFRKLMTELTDLLITRDGPIILVQIEQNWACGNDDSAAAYLGDVARILRECGVNVPLCNGNNLWADPVGTIDTWQGRDDLLGHLRQLRLVQQDAPRIVSGFDVSEIPVWGEEPDGALAPDEALRRFGEILAAGAQPVVRPFHGGTYFGALAGSVPGGMTVSTSGAAGAPLGEAGERNASWYSIRRLALFANHFEHLFADLDPEYQPVTLDAPYHAGKKAGKSGATIQLVPLRGGGGKLVFVFSDRIGGTATLLMQNGLRLPVDLGDQPVGWYVADLDLQGQARLDYANISPVAMSGRRLVVFQGPAKLDAVLSIAGTPIEATIPQGKKPLVIEHKGMQLVLCNQQQIDALVIGEDCVYVGASGLDADGAPLALAGWAKPYRIDADGTIESVKPIATAAKKPKGSVKLAQWDVADGTPYADGTSPRYASLAGPEDLPSCGASTGYGWYGMTVKSSSAKTVQLLSPGLGGRVHFYVDGAPQLIYGPGPDGTGGPIALKLKKGEQTIVTLVDNYGRPCEGHDIDIPIGFRDHLHEVKAMTTKPSWVEDNPIDPFSLRAFIYGAGHGAGSDPMMVEWSFKHLKKSPIFLHFEDVKTPCTVVLNGEPLTFHAGETGLTRRTVLLDPEHELFKRGVNTLRLAPLPGRADDLKAELKQITLFQTAPFSADARWTFAKWEPPAAGRFESVSATAASGHKGRPTWWKTTVDVSASDVPVWFETTGLSKGWITVNGHEIGRYFTRTADSKPVGPQQRLRIPACWLNADGPNDILIFDEHGHAPHKTKISYGTTGDLD